MGRLVDLLVRLAARSRSRREDVLHLAVGGTMFLAVVPAVLVAVGAWLERYLRVPCPRGVELALGGLLGPVSLAWLAWTVRTQWTVGLGTPAPSAPTRRLITTGPYALCRNPLQLGAIGWWLALGCLCHSLTAGLVPFTVGLVCGTIYHRWVEEQELRRRFGEEYETYRRTTPFLIPRRHRAQDICVL